jgi:hypothetical protein
MSALQLRIPIGHAAHWKLTDEGKIEVELLRFLTLGDAKRRRERHHQRKEAA